MKKHEPDHPITYRKAIVNAVSSSIKDGESCAIIGAASMGKSRLIHFLLREDIQQEYLADGADQTLLVWADCNRMAEISEWGLYELILTALAETVDGSTRQPLLDLREQAIIEHNALLAQRNVEMAMRLLCREEGYKIALILDEFDQSYRTLNGQTLENLRALRDRNKYALSYILFMRDDPIFLREVDDSEGFYELFSRSVIGLTPYNEADSKSVIDQILARRTAETLTLPPDFHAQLFTLSGGHPGLLVALIHEYLINPPTGKSWSDWAGEAAKAHEECRKIWHGLRESEQLALRHIVSGAEADIDAHESLLLKGLINCGENRQSAQLFSPLLTQYVESQASIVNQPLTVDSKKGDVWINGQTVKGLTAKEFKLIAYLYEHKNEIRSADEIIDAIYDENERFDIDKGNISQLVKRVRGKIESDTKHYRYLVNSRGRGYRLVVSSESATELQS